MGTKGWIIFSVIVVAILGGLVVLSGKDKIDVSKVDQNSIVTASEQTGNIEEHVFGNAKSKVVLIEYGDFQCPACGGAHPNLKRITEEYKDKIAFIFRNYPLTSIHPNARAASAAAEAAGLQGKYWEMHDALYESQDGWSSSDATDRTSFFITQAKSIGVKNLEKFQQDLASKEINKKISFDLALGKKAGASGTPTFVLNGTRLSEEITNDAVGGQATKLEDEIKKLL